MSNQREMNQVKIIFLIRPSEVQKPKIRQKTGVYMIKNTKTFFHRVLYAFFEFNVNVWSVWKIKVCYKYLNIIFTHLIQRYCLLFNDLLNTHALFVWWRSSWLSCRWHLWSQAEHLERHVKYSSGKDRWLVGLTSPENFLLSAYKTILQY